MDSDNHHDVAKLYALWLMPVPLVIHLLAKYLDTDGEIFHRWIESESGFIENGTVLLLIPAAIFLFIVTLRFWKNQQKSLAIWFLLAALVCVGFAGEEASWGQHWVGWQSPEYFEEHNRQGETNFHNLNIQFGRLVKSILTLMIIVGGLILPLTRNAAESSESFFGWIVATRVSVAAASFVLLVRVVERLKTWFDLDWFLLTVNLKELQELYIAIFLFIYAWSIKIRTTTLSAKR